VDVGKVGLSGLWVFSTPVVAGVTALSLVVPFLSNIFFFLPFFFFFCYVTESGICFSSNITHLPDSQVARVLLRDIFSNVTICF
jgi:hypothetical protein